MNGNAEPIAPAESAPAAQPVPAAEAAAAAESAPASRPARGIPWPATLYALGAIAMFVTMALCIRALAHHVPAGDIAFYRAFFGIIMLAPLFFGGGWARAKRNLATRRIGLFGLRALVTYLAIASYFFALTRISLAEAIALNSTLPIWMTAMAAIFLHEQVDPRRWIAIGVGFLGTLVIVRPGFAVVSWATIAALTSAALYGGAAILVKMLARTEPPGRIVFYMNLFMVVLAAGPFLYDFTLPRWSDMPFILGVGLAGTLAHYSQSNALKRADASFVAPFDFLRLPLSAFCGYLIFDDRPGIWVWIGASMVFAGTILVTKRGRRAR
jgi:drug/metabolite transporter (DMT)-like permease